MLNQTCISCSRSVVIRLDYTQQNVTKILMSKSTADEDIGGTRNVAKIVI